MVCSVCALMLSSVSRTQVLFGSSEYRLYIWDNVKGKSNAILFNNVVQSLTMRQNCNLVPKLGKVTHAWLMLIIRNVM